MAVASESDSSPLKGYLLGGETRAGCLWFGRYSKSRTPLFVLPSKLDYEAGGGRSIFCNFVFLEVDGHNAEVNREIESSFPYQADVSKPESECLLVTGGLVEYLLPFCQPVDRSSQRPVLDYRAHMFQVIRVDILPNCFGWQSRRPSQISEPLAYQVVCQAGWFLVPGQEFVVSFNFLGSDPFPSSLSIKGVSFVE